MEYLKTAAAVLLIVGGLNWGLVGLLNLNLVTSVLGEGSMLTNVVYDLVGLAAVYEAYVLLTKAGK